jgi:DNA-directed RNA polymerase subunit omega
MLLVPQGVKTVLPPRHFMNAQLLEDAAKIITEPQVLINAVSRRVRQLTAGSRPMVEVELRMGLADIALMEIAKGKLAVAPKPAA